MAEIPAGLDPVPHAENTALVAHSLVERVKGIEPALPSRPRRSGDSPRLSRMPGGWMRRRA